MNIFQLIQEHYDIYNASDNVEEKILKLIFYKLPILPSNELEMIKNYCNDYMIFARINHLIWKYIDTNEPKRMFNVLEIIEYILSHNGSYKFVTICNENIKKFQNIANNKHFSTDSTRHIQNKATKIIQIIDEKILEKKESDINRLQNIINQKKN